MKKIIRLSSSIGSNATIRNSGKLDFASNNDDEIK